MPPCLALLCPAPLTPADDVFVHRKHGAAVVGVVDAVPIGACMPACTHASTRSTSVPLLASDDWEVRTEAPPRLIWPAAHMCRHRSAELVRAEQGQSRAGQGPTHTHQRCLSSLWALHGWPAAPRGCCRTPTSPCSKRSHAPAALVSQYHGSATYACAVSRAAGRRQYAAGSWTPTVLNVLTAVARGGPHLLSRQGGVWPSCSPNRCTKPGTSPSRTPPPSGHCRWLASAALSCSWRA